MSDDSVVPIPAHAVLWNILAQEGPWSVQAREGATDRHLPTVVLEWGWDAGLSAEQLAVQAPDVPRGKATVRTTLEDARRLHAQLGDLLGLLDRKVAENPPPPPTPGLFDLIMLYILEERDRTGASGPVSLRAVMEKAPPETADTFTQVLAAAKDLPATPGEDLRAWHARLLERIKEQRPATP